MCCISCEFWVPSALSGPNLPSHLSPTLSRKGRHKQGLWGQTLSGQLEEGGLWDLSQWVPGLEWYLVCNHLFSEGLSWSLSQVGKPRPKQGK